MRRRVRGRARWSQCRTCPGSTSKRPGRPRRRSNERRAFGLKSRSTMTLSTVSTKRQAVGTELSETTALMELDEQHRARADSVRRQLEELELQHARDRAALMDRYRRRAGQRDRSDSNNSSFIAPTLSTGSRGGIGRGSMRSPSPGMSFGGGSAARPGGDRPDPNHLAATGEAMRRLLFDDEATPQTQASGSRRRAVSSQGGTRTADFALQACALDPLLSYASSLTP